MADTCSSLAAEIAALRAEIARIPRVDEARIVQTTRGALQPDISTAVIAGGAVITSKLKPEIDTALKRSSDAFLEAVANTRKQRLLEIEQQGQNSRATAAERRAGEYAQRLAAQEAKAAQLDRETVRLGRENKALELSDTDLREITRRNEVESRRARNVAERLENEIPAIRNTANSAKGIAERATEGIAEVRATATKALSTAGTAISDAASATGKAINTANEVTGLKGVIDGVGSRINALGNAIGKAEAMAANALTQAAKAIGISEQALGSIAKLGGQVLQIFNVIGTIFTILDGMATREVLGARMDALENGLDRLGNEVSRILGKILGLQNRIARNEATIGEVRGIAIDAKGIGEGAQRLAGQAVQDAVGAQATAATAQGTATTAQTTADGAIRNANQANENAKTAYQKATEATTTANNATTIANQATTTANRATNKAGEAFGKAVEALGVALTAIALYQGIKSLRGLPGLQGIPGVRGLTGERGIRGLEGAPGVSLVVQIPGVPGRDGINGRDGFSGLTGRPGINGLPGRNGVDAVPYNDAGLKAFIAAQHGATRGASSANHQSTRITILTPIMAVLAPILALLKSIYDAVMAISSAAIMALLNIINAKLGVQVIGGLSQFIKSIAENTYIEKALAVLTFATTLHNAVILSSNLGTTLMSIVDSIVGLILPKGLDGKPIILSDVLGKAVQEIISQAGGKSTATAQIEEKWNQANRIYQAALNVHNQVLGLGGVLTAGMEVIGGNVGKIGNALRKGGVLLEDAYTWMNPQPNLKGKFFQQMNLVGEKAQAIALVVAIPIALAECKNGVDTSVAELHREIAQVDPKKADGQPETRPDGSIIHYEPGLKPPVPVVEGAKNDQSKADSTNFLALVLEDIFDGGD